MDFENVCKLMECFDSSESVYLELEMPEFSIKLKKAEAYKDTVAPAMAPMPAMQMPVMPAQQFASADVAGVANTASAQTSDAAQKTVDENDYVKAPLVGVFYAAPAPDKAPFVQVGSHVEKGETICLIEAMKMMSEVVAPKSGTIKEILVENGDMVEFDAPLFVIQE